MQSRKKTAANLIFLIVIFVLTVYGVFRGEDLPGMIAAIKDTDVRWLALGVLCVVFFIWGESIIIWYLLDSFQISVRKSTCFLFSSVGFFFSCITPSASGGQPMQLYYMKKEKISLPVSAVILMIVTITYKFVLVAAGVGILFFGRGFLHRYLEGILPIFYLGIVLNILCVTAMLVLVFHPVLARSILVKGLFLLERYHILKKKESRLKRLENSMDVYRDTAAYLGTHKLVMARVLAVTFAQRTALFAATWFVYRAFRLSGTTPATIILLQAVIAVSVDMLPLPGGMGISETLFLKIFQPVFGELILAGMVLSRGLGYYGELLVSAVFTVAAQLTIGHKRQGVEQQQRIK
ncbi:MAG: YbhN family protein [Fusicatenibacter sp.]|nr:flippase-like domain-containing protein [Fusicatenibacter sp.]